MALTVIATITAKPGSEQTVHDALTALVPLSRKDQGCISYDLYQSTADATVFMTVEQWESEADLQAHMESPHLVQAATEAGPYFAKPFEVATLAAVDA